LKSEQKTSVELEFHRGLFLGLVPAFDPEPTSGNTIPKRQFSRYPLPDSPDMLSEYAVIVW